MKKVIIAALVVLSLSAVARAQTLVERVDALLAKVEESWSKGLTATRRAALTADLATLKALLSALPPNQAILDQLTRIEGRLTPIVSPPVVTPPVVTPPVVVVPPVVISPQPTSSACTVRATDGNPQAAMDAAPTGAVLCLTPGATYTGNLTYRGQGLTLRTDVADSAVLPAVGGWIDGPAMLGKLARLTPADETRPVLSTAPGASNLTLAALELQGGAYNDETVLALGDASGTAAAAQGTGFTLDRVWLHAGANGNVRGIGLNAGSTRIVRSYIADFWRIGRDSQAIAGWNGPGPYVIESNYLEATGNAILFGGGDPRIQGLIPSDITIRGNLMSKPLAWRDTKRGSVKNILELKNAQRVVIENNVMERNWPDAQNGAAILFTIRNQDGGCPWCVVQDVTMRYNLLRDVDGMAVNMLGKDDIHTSAQGQNITIEHLLCVRCGDGFNVNNGFTTTTIRNVTLLGTRGRAIYFIATPAQGFTFRDNLAEGGTYGVIGDGTAPGNGTLATYAPGAVFTGNIMTPGAAYPAGNEVVAPLPVSAQYRYTGTRAPAPGVDVTELQRRIPWVTF